MSEFQHFWCRFNYNDDANWVVINLDKISSIRYPKDENDFYYVDIDGSITYLFTKKELERLLLAMSRNGHRLYDGDGNQT